MRDKRPFLVVNPKSYLYGESALALALAADDVARDTGLTVYFTCPYADIRLISRRARHIIVTAQHMQPLRPGRGMGHVLPESLLEAGARAVFLNHAEQPLTLTYLYQTIARARELDMTTIVCADSVAEGLAAAMLSPDILLCEPTDLIGTGQVAGEGYTVEAVRRIRRANPDVAVMIASGVTTAEDVYNIIRLGADGTGATSGILGAPDPALRIREMALAVLRGAQDRPRYKEEPA